MIYTQFFTLCFFVIIGAMNLKILFLVISLVSVSVFGMHQSAQAEKGDEKLISFVDGKTTLRPGESISIFATGKNEPGINIGTFYAGYTISIFEEGKSVAIKRCNSVSTCKITVTASLRDIENSPFGKYGKEVTKTYTAEIRKFQTIGEGSVIIGESDSLTITWKVPLSIFASPPNPKVGQDVIIKAVADMELQGTLYSIRIYEEGEEIKGTKKQEWSCGIKRVCETPETLIRSNEEAVKFYTADISKLVDTANGSRVKKVLAFTGPVTVTWGVTSLDIKSSNSNPKVDESVTITATAAETVQGTSYNIFIYEEGIEEPIATCGTTDTCSAKREKSVIPVTKTYTAEVSKRVAVATDKDQDGRSVKVVQSRGSTTVRWSEEEFFPVSGPECPVGQRGGLVPCGRSCDNPKTEIDEAADCTFCSFFYLFNNIVKWVVTIIVPTIAVLLIAIGGFMLAMSRGNPGQLQKGKDILIWTLAGIAVMFIGWAVLNSLLSGIGVMKWTGLRAETGEFEKYEVRTDGDHLLQDFDIDKKSDEAWERSDKGSGWKGLTVELSHPDWPEPQIRKITSNNEHSIRIDKPLYNTTQEKGAKIKYKIGGWWQFSCGTE